MCIAVWRHCTTATLYSEWFQTPLFDVYAVIRSWYYKFTEPNKAVTSLLPKLVNATQTIASIKWQRLSLTAE